MHAMIAQPCPRLSAPRPSRLLHRPGRYRRRGRSVGLLSLVCLLAVTFSACGQPAPPPSAIEVLSAMIEADPGLPAGSVYHRAVPADDPAYIGDDLLAALYGPAVRSFILAQNTIEITTNATTQTPCATTDSPRAQIAVFLSKALHPGEVAVFRCSDSRTVMAAASLCRTRLDTVRRAWADTDYAALVDRGLVAVEGEYVLLVIAEDPAAILAAVRRVVRG